MGTSLFPFKDLPDALIQAGQGKLEQSNTVIKVSN
jgi:hypothetical protein